LDLSSLLTSRAVAAIGAACIALSALSALWAMVKLSYQRALGRPMPRNALTGTLDVLAELAVNVVGAVSRVIQLRGGDGLFRPTVPPVPPSVGPLAPPPDQGGYVEGGAMLGVCVLALAASLFCAGCPNWHRPACPTLGAYSCLNGQPHYCARATHELTPIGDEPCAAQGRACAFNDAGQSFCARLDAAVSE